MELEYLGARELLTLELRQRRESGFETGPVEDAVAAALADATADPARLFDLLDEMAGLERRADWSYDEPEGLEAILASLPPDPGPTPLTRDPADAIRAAWTGRCVGCNLGKPVEWGDHWTPAHIRDYLTLADAWPLVDYIPVLDPMPRRFELNESWPTSTRGNIDGSARDDDIDYALLGLAILEQYGSAPSTEQIATALLERLPALATYTAERVAYRNLLGGVALDAVGEYRNPFREWIGAQIRADVFGLSHPGDPRTAAVRVHEDARLSHRGNGVYAAMWAAALIALSFTTTSARDAVERSLAHVPPGSRLHEAVSSVLTDHERGVGWEQTRAGIQERYGGYHWVHAVNNAAVLVAGLLHGEGDFTRTIGLTVSGGLDTDSSGASAGCVAGVLLGGAAIEAHWTEPLHDRIHSALTGFDGTRISDAAARTLALVQG